jgi:fructose-specific phosphotransferase system IIC component
MFAVPMFTIMFGVSLYTPNMLSFGIFILMALVIGALFGFLFHRNNLPSLKFSFFLGGLYLVFLVVAGFSALSLGAEPMSNIPPWLLVFVSSALLTFVGAFL